MHVQPSLLIDPFDKTDLSTTCVLIYLLRQEEVACVPLVLYFIIFLSCTSSPSKQIQIFDKRTSIMPTPYFVRGDIKAIGGTIVY